MPFLHSRRSFFTIFLFTCEMFSFRTREHVRFVSFRFYYSSQHPLRYVISLALFTRCFFFPPSVQVNVLPASRRPGWTRYLDASSIGNRFALAGRLTPRIPRTVLVKYELQQFRIAGERPKAEDTHPSTCTYSVWPCVVTVISSEPNCDERVLDAFAEIATAFGQLRAIADCLAEYSKHSAPDIGGNQF